MGPWASGMDEADGSVLSAGIAGRGAATQEVSCRSSRACWLPSEDIVVSSRLAGAFSGVEEERRFSASIAGAAAGGSPSDVQPDMLADTPLAPLKWPGWLVELA